MIWMNEWIRQLNVKRKKYWNKRWDTNHSNNTTRNVSKSRRLRSSSVVGGGGDGGCAAAAADDGLLSLSLFPLVSFSFPSPSLVLSTFLLQSCPVSLAMIFFFVHRSVRSLFLSFSLSLIRSLTFWIFQRFGVASDVVFSFLALSAVECLHFAEVFFLLLSFFFSFCCFVWCWSEATVLFSREYFIAEPLKHCWAHWMLVLYCRCVCVSVFVCSLAKLWSCRQGIDQQKNNRHIWRIKQSRQERMIVSEWETEKKDRERESNWKTRLAQLLNIRRRWLWCWQRQQHRRMQCSSGIQCEERGEKKGYVSVSVCMRVWSTVDVKTKLRSLSTTSFLSFGLFSFKRKELGGEKNCEQRWMLQVWGHFPSTGLELERNESVKCRPLVSEFRVLPFFSDFFSYFLFVSSFVF